MNNDTPLELTWTGIVSFRQWMNQQSDKRFFAAAQRGPEKSRKFKEDEGKWRDE